MSFSCKGLFGSQNPLPVIRLTNYVFTICPLDAFCSFWLRKS